MFTSTMLLAHSGAKLPGSRPAARAASRHSSRNSSARFERIPLSSTRKNSCSSPMRRCSKTVNGVQHQIKVANPLNLNPRLGSCNWPGGESRGGAVGPTEKTPPFRQRRVDRRVDRTPGARGFAACIRESSGGRMYRRHPRWRSRTLYLCPKNSHPQGRIVARSSFPAPARRRNFAGLPGHTFRKVW